MQRVLPHEKIKARIADLAVGLSSDCDNPEHDVEKIMRAHLSGASTLPFVGFITHDGKWVNGFSGFKNDAAFLKVLEQAEDTPYLKASKAVRKKLAGLVATAGKAAERNDWKAVLKAARAAGKTTGRCPERVEMAVLANRARAWAKTELDAAFRFARSGDFPAARTSLKAVRKNFTGHPEGEEAKVAEKAVTRLAKIVAAEASEKPPAPGVREKAARPFEGSRWATIFERQADTDGDD